MTDSNDFYDDDEGELATAVAEQPAAPSRPIIDPDRPLPNNAPDVHASKIDPNDPRLKLEKPRGRTLKKGPVILIAGAGAILTVVALISGLNPSKPGAGGEDEEAETAPSSITIPGAIKNASIAAPVPKDVPALGAPLPGDLGAAMVTPRDKAEWECAQAAQRGENRPGCAGIAPAAGTAPAGGNYTGAPTGTYADPNSRESQAALIRQQQLEKAYQAGVFFASADTTAAEDEAANLDGAAGAPAGMNGQLAMLRDMQQKATAQLNNVLGGGGGEPAGGSPTDGLSFAGLPGLSDDGGFGAQNNQAGKQAFLAGGGRQDQDYVKAGMSKPRSPYEVKAGSVVPIALISGLNSDLPGEVIGQVRENVYDTVTGNHLLIPQGSRVLANYDSGIAYGQDRVLVCWNRLIRPDGTSINLECQTGTDLAGYSGFADEVNHHWGRLIGGVLLSSILAATAESSQGSVQGFNPSFSQSVASNAGSEINQAGQAITRKNLNMQPTVTVRPGFSVNMLVSKDMIIPPYTGGS